ncbi:MAG: ATP-dependent helicase [Candidatus Eisenbacteria bacterium]
MHPDDPEVAILSDLNDVQLEAVTHGDGPLLILAGAGSGKTRVLTRRVASLVLRGVDPERILAVTFTNKAAGEMRERVSTLLGERARGIWIGTFHSIGLRILKRHQHVLGFHSLTVFDADDSLDLIRKVLKDAPGIAESGLKPREAREAISTAKNRLLTPDRLESMGGPNRQRIARVWRLYEKRLREQDGADFDDLLLLVLDLFEIEPEIGERYARRFQHVLVDEYQDTNRVQFEIVRRLAAVHGNVTVVGDDDQSIYAWRGADITNILEFERHFPGAAALRLEQNYRSTTAILDVAHAVIKNNVGRKPKKLWTDKGAGEPVRFVLAEDEEQEAYLVARAIRERMREADLRPSSFAILYRTHAQSRPLEEALIRAEIPYRVVGGVSFFQRREVKDLLAYLRLLVNPRDEISFRRAALAPKRGAGETTIERIVAAARERGIDLLDAAVRAVDLGVPGRGLTGLAEMGRMLQRMTERVAVEPPHRLLEEIVEAIGYRAWLDEEYDGDGEDRFAHVLELIEGAESYEGSEEGSDLAGFLEQIALFAQADEAKAGEDRVTLMTTHNAKGLEFDEVFVTGLEEGLFPHASSFDDPQELEEERRLFYVAATRARRRLTLTAGRERRRINMSGPTDLSRFLAEIPPELLATEQAGWSYALRSYYRPSGPPPRRYGGGRSGAAGRNAGAQTGSGYRRGGGQQDMWLDREAAAANAAAAAAAAAAAHMAAGGHEPTIEREAPVRRIRGLRAKHIRFGTGEVISIEGEGTDARVEVRFPNWGVKRILRAYLAIEDGDEEREGKPDGGAGTRRGGAGP